MKTKIVQLDEGLNSPCCAWASAIMAGILIAMSSTMLFALLRERRRHLIQIAELENIQDENCRNRLNQRFYYSGQIAILTALIPGSDGELGRWETIVHSVSNQINKTVLYLDDHASNTTVNLLEARSPTNDERARIAWKILQKEAHELIAPNRAEDRISF